MTGPVMSNPNSYPTIKSAGLDILSLGVFKNAVWSAVVALVGTIVAAHLFVSSVSSSVGQLLSPQSETEAQLKRYWYTTYHQPPTTGELAKIVRQYVLDIQQKNLSNDLVSYMTDELAKVLDRELTSSEIGGRLKKR